MILILLAVENVVDLIEDTAHVADQNDEDEEPVEDVVDNIEAGSDDVILEPIMEHFDFIYLSQIH